MDADIKITGDYLITCSVLCYVHKTKHETHETRDYRNKTGTNIHTETQTKTCKLDTETGGKQTQKKNRRNRKGKPDNYRDMKERQGRRANITGEKDDKYYLT